MAAMRMLMPFSSDICLVRTSVSCICFEFISAIACFGSFFVLEIGQEGRGRRRCRSDIVLKCASVGAWCFV